MIYAIECTKFFGVEMEAKQGLANEVAQKSEGFLGGYVAGRRTIEDAWQTKTFYHCSEPCNDDFSGPNLPGNCQYVGIPESLAPALGIKLPVPSIPA